MLKQDGRSSLGPTSQGRVSRANAEHDEVLKAMAAGDVAGAMLATRQHIEAGWHELRASVETG